MDVSSKDISSLVFKSSIRSDIDEFSLNTRMLKLLMELDGKKDLASVSRAVHMDMETIRRILAKLYHLKLIEPVKRHVPVLNKDFFNFLSINLSMALGPIAQILIEDEINEFSDDPYKIPVNQAAELVNLLARQIPRKEKRVAFQQAMFKKIKDIQTQTGS